MIDPDHLNRFDNHLGDPGWPNIATSDLIPIAHANHSARGGDLLHQRIGKVAFDIAMRADASVAHNEGCVRHFKHVSGDLRAGMGQVKDHAAFGHLGHHGAAKIA